MPTLRQWQQAATASLQPLYDQAEAQALVQVLLSELLALPRHTLVLQQPQELSADKLQQLTAALARLQAAEPLQYVLGYAHFMGLRVQVSPAVLIPRPETEELVRWILALHAGQSPTILDVGTGSGCIALALAHALPQAKVIGLDVSPAALAVAQNNAETLGTPVQWQQAELSQLAPDAFQGLDIIVSNPPYIPPSEAASLHPNVAKYEPSLALFTPQEDALFFYRQLALLGRQWLRPGGCLFAEIHTPHAMATAALFQARGWVGVQLKDDLQRRERMLLAKNPA